MKLLLRLFISNVILLCMNEYLGILIFLCMALAMSIGMLIVPFILAKYNPNKEKSSDYECGFAPLGDTRRHSSIRFYLVAILFIIFDLEIAFLFPWAIVLETIGVFGFWSMMVFLGILTIGFIYEWKKGALDWE